MSDTFYDWTTIGELSTAIVLILGAVGGLCSVMQRSKCENINICCGLLSCKRKPKEEKREVIKEEPLTSELELEETAVEPLIP